MDNLHTTSRWNDSRASAYLLTPNPRRGGGDVDGDGSKVAQPFCRSLLRKHHRNDYLHHTAKLLRTSFIAPPRTQTHTHTLSQTFHLQAAKQMAAGNFGAEEQTVLSAHHRRPSSGARRLIVGSHLNTAIKLMECVCVCVCVGGAGCSLVLCW